MRDSSLFDEVANNDKYKYLHFDRVQLEDDLGYDLEDWKFIDLNAVTTEELVNMLQKVTMWSTRMNELIATAKRYLMDRIVDKEAYIVARTAHYMSRKENPLNKTNARDQIKTEEKFKNAEKDLNLLEVYVDYMKGLLDILNKYHYFIKHRIDSVKQEERRGY